MECSVFGTGFAYSKANSKSHKGVMQLFTGTYFTMSARILLGNLFLVGNAEDLL